MKKMLISIIVGLFLTACSGKAGLAQEWFPSQYGTGDTLGAANRLTPDMALAAATLVKTGQVYSLGTIVDESTPAYGTRSYRVITTQGTNVDGVYSQSKATFHDDLVIHNPGIGSQIDGLGHAGINHVYYNGMKPDEFSTRAGLSKLGTESIPPIVTRGVLLDMASYFGVEVVSAGKAFNKKEILGAAQKQNVVLRNGDVVIFHSGWPVKVAEDSAKNLYIHPGLGKEGAEYLSQIGVVAVGADTPALEVIPFEVSGQDWVVHQTLLAKKGVYILEGLKTDELIKDGVTEFLFVLGQPKLRGTVQAIINPIAIR